VKEDTKVYFKTFGCRTNIVDTQIMINNLKDFFIVCDETKANIVVINSCTVTNGADATVRGYINSLRRLPNKPRIIFTGCGVWTKGKQLYDENKIDALFGHSEKEQINTLLKDKNRFYKAGDLKHIDKTIIETLVGRSKAFVKIQEGCDFRCNYCVIPYVRGDARNYDEKYILKQISLLASNGFGEFILTGTNVGSYGKNNQNKKDKLAILLKKISQIKGVKRIRLGSIEPIQITDEFKEILDEPWMGRYLHIALQHTSPAMLRIMNRRNKMEQDLKLFEFLSSKGYALGTDFIVGHPGESEEFWQEAKTNIQKFPLTHIHSFTYSKRDGTVSSNLPNQVDTKIAKQRLKELQKIIKIKNYNFRKQKQPLKVLIEQKKDNQYQGYDQYFNQILIQSDLNLIGNWIQIDDYQVQEDINKGKF